MSSISRLTLHKPKEHEKYMCNEELSDKKNITITANTCLDIRKQKYVMDQYCKAREVYFTTRKQSRQ